MSRQWTENQLKAVEARGMQVLVSAAAGSGKTTVLTERVKNILTDVDNPCSVSELLVVTFTRAAATEMCDRIYESLKEATSTATDKSDYLRRQMIMLPTADICTIDSFCFKIVKENFSLADVGVDFRLLDEKEATEIMSMALDEVIDKLYEENDEAFNALTKMFLNERDDKLLGEVIKTLYNYSRSYPSPKNWLDKITDSFNSEKTPNETVWADSIYKFLSLFSDFHYSRLMRCVALMEESGGFSPDYLRRFSVSADNVLALKTNVENKNWDGIVDVIRTGIVAKFPARNYKVDEDLKKLTQDVFSEFEDDVESLEKRALPTIEEHKTDSERLYPIVKKLSNAVEMLSVALNGYKKELNAYTFDDVLHKCIDLLVVFDGDNWRLTPLGMNLRKKYKEILIDEYQDTNEAQNIIFEALSDDCKNLYCVGDVKQSIYRFRLASPELFMNLRDGLSEYTGEKQPSQITLDRNFRSRKGIDEAVNYVFSTLMSRAVGEIDYTDREKLTFGADYYPEKATPDTEIICIDAESMKSAEATIAEADAVAEYIKRIINSKVLITTKNGQRPVRSSDFCILLRSVKNKIKVFVDALKKQGISSSAILDGDTSDCKEIQLLISLIKVINNPLIDIPLIAVLMSPIFGFTADELAEIRMVERHADLFACLQRYAEKSSKARYFINKFNLYRNISSSLPIGEFVKFLVDDTGIIDLYLSTVDGEMRRANIRGFMKFANDYSQNGRIGLGAFIRYLDNAVENETLRSYGDFGAFEGVQIMSIHKSKGLEFPYVIVADCSKGFNRQDSYKSLNLSRETGIGLRIRDDELFTRYHTLSSAATEKSILFGDASEELRVLYVAMTRAKEHLTFVCSITGKSIAKSVRLNNTLSISKEGKLHPYAVYKSSSMCEWLLTCFASHNDCAVIRDLCSLDSSVIRENEFSVDTSFVDAFGETEEIIEADVEEPAPVDRELLERLEERTAYKYAFDCSGILAKVTASSVENQKIPGNYFAKRKPAFLDTTFTGADRGTAIHKFLELCDFKTAVVDLEAEKRRLISNGSMTEKELEVLDSKAIDAFFSDDVGRRLLSSEKVLKEYEFAFFENAGEIYDEISAHAFNEEIVIQGKLDCAFIEDGEAILVDYKSDNISDESVFKEIYSPQLEIYSKALLECEGLKVKEKYIFSFKLKKFIKI